MEKYPSLKKGFLKTAIHINPWDLLAFWKQNTEESARR